MAGHTTDHLHWVRPGEGPFLLHRGESWGHHRLPVNTRVIYPKPSLPALPDRRAAIQQALDNPLGQPALRDQLKAGMKVTIAFDDISLPLPSMTRPDIRQDVIELVVAACDEAGVTDIDLMVAICLHRKLTPAEIRHMVGDAVFNRFYPAGRLRNYDAEDTEANTHLGETEEGEEVEISTRAVESDLLVYVNINLVAMDGGHKSIPIGLGTYRSVRHHHNAHMLLHDSSYMDVDRSHFHRSCERMGAIVEKKVRCFHIETTVNNDLYPWHLKFLAKRERNWNPLDRLSSSVMSTAMDILPTSMRRKLYQSNLAPYGMTSVQAGDVDLVHAKTLEAVHAQHVVDVPDQCDILLLGMPSIGPYSVNSIMNPILVYCNSVGYFYNFYIHRPLVRQGGVMIVNRPMTNEFHPVHHPSYIDFFNDLLPQTRCPRELGKRFEADYAANPRYKALYQRTQAYHGVHPFYMWYWGAHGKAQLSRVIVVNPDRTAVERIGFESAPTLDAAIGMARESVGDGARMSYFHNPPLLQCRLPA